MTATRSGTSMPSSPAVTRSASEYTSTCARPHDGQETISSLRGRRLRLCRIWMPTLTSSTGGALRDTRMVSPMPRESSAPKAVADLMVPWKAGPASVTPRCSGQSPRSASSSYARTITTGSLCLTEILKSWKSCSSKRPASQTADSTSASGVALPYFSRIRLSRLPALTPIRIDVPRSFAARAISLTWSSNLRMLPGLTRTAAHPASIAAKTYFGWKWMSAITGICECWAISASASASSWLGHATRTMSQPDAVSSAICCSVVLTSAVNVVVIDCTEIGASPPTRTLPTRICRLGRRGASTGGGAAGIPRSIEVMWSFLVSTAAMKAAARPPKTLADAHGRDDVAGDEHQRHDKQQSRDDVRHRQQLRDVDEPRVRAAQHAGHTTADAFVERAGHVSAVQRQQRHEVEHADEEVQSREEAEQEDDPVAHRVGRVRGDLAGDATGPDDADRA